MKTLRKILGFLGLGLALVLVLGVEGYRWTHPDLTEMRIFLNTWPVSVIAVATFLLGGLLWFWDDQ